MSDLRTNSASSLSPGVTPVKISTPEKSIYNLYGLLGGRKMANVTGTESRSIQKNFTEKNQNTFGRWISNFVRSCLGWKNTAETKSFTPLNIHLSEENQRYAPEACMLFTQLLAVQKLVGEGIEKSTDFINSYEEIGKLIPRAKALVDAMTVSARACFPKDLPEDKKREDYLTRLSLILNTARFSYGVASEKYKIKASQQQEAREKFPQSSTVQKGIDRFSEPASDHFEHLEVLSEENRRYAPEACDLFTKILALRERVHDRIQKPNNALDAKDFKKLMEHIDYLEALQELQEKQGVQIKERTKDINTFHEGYKEMNKLLGNAKKLVNDMTVSAQACFPNDLPEKEKETYLDSLKEVLKSAEVADRRNAEVAPPYWFIPGEDAYEIIPGL